MNVCRLLVSKHGKMNKGNWQLGGGIRPSRFIAFVIIQGRETIKKGLFRLFRKYETRLFPKTGTSR